MKIKWDTRLKMFWKAWNTIQNHKILILALAKMGDEIDDIEKYLK